jgi:hypothetical protein
VGATALPPDAGTVVTFWTTVGVLAVVTAFPPDAGTVVTFLAVDDVFPERRSSRLATDAPS